MHDDMPDHPGPLYWFCVAAVVLTILLGLVTVTTAAEAPLPRPKPAKCISVANAWNYAGLYEQRGGTVLYWTRRETADWLRALNAIPPASAVRAETAMVLVGNVHQVLLISGACMVGTMAFNEKQWASIDKQMGQPV